MHLIKTSQILIVLAGVAVIAATSAARAQSWQPTRSTDDGRSAWQSDETTDASTAATDWEQRTIKRPLSWQGRNGQSATSNPTSGRTTQDARAVFGQQDVGPIRRTSYNQAAGGDEPIMQQPTVRSQPRVPSGETVIPEPIPRGTQFEPLSTDGPMADEGFMGRGGCSSCGEGGCDSFGDCGEGGCGRSDSCHDWPIFRGDCGLWLRGLSVFAGADAFKGPMDRGTNGNFGVNEGLNLSRPLGDPWGCGYQIGANFVQTDFSGVKALVADDTTTASAPYRKQYFATAAIFRRAECSGFQWGVAYDYLHDIYVGDVNLQQVRSETNYLFNNTWELGYFGAYGVGTDRDRVIDGKLDPTDMFCGYVRRYFENGGNGRIFGGATGNGDGLIGADLWVPLGGHFALQNEINYRIPKRGNQDSTDTSSTPHESWGFVMQLVWYPGQRANCERNNPYRPMFNVADNSLFMVDRLAQ
ncbi:MAG: DUF6666 family protein [Thermoguttaceae bacterium]